MYGRDRIKEMMRYPKVSVVVYDHHEN